MVDLVANLTAEVACEALHSAGVSCSPEDVVLVAREQRWAVSLPGERIAWVSGVRAGETTPRHRAPRLAPARRAQLHGLSPHKICKLTLT
jgi:hypothetical protein